MLVVLLSSFSVGKKGTPERINFIGDRKKYQEIPDKYFDLTFVNNKGEEEKVLKSGRDYLTVDMVAKMERDKELTPIGAEMLKKSLESIKSKPKKEEVKK